MTSCWRFAKLGVKRSYDIGGLVPYQCCPIPASELLSASRPPSWALAEQSAETSIENRVRGMILRNVAMALHYGGRVALRDGCLYH